MKKNKILSKIIAPVAVGAGCLAITPATSCGGKMYYDLKPIAPYLHEISYDDYREDVDYETIDEAEAFGCSSVRCGDFYGRNFDYVYNDTPEFIVHMKANAAKKRHASLAICTHFGLRENKLRAGKYDKQLELIPNLTMDGVNDAGVICSGNVVSMEPNGEEGVQVPETCPNDSDAKDLHVMFIPRYVLDHAGSAEEAVNLLSNKVEGQQKVNIMGNLNKAMNIHIMIADKTSTYVVEFFRDKKNKDIHHHFDVIAKQKFENATADNDLPIMTNHYVNNTDEYVNNWINDEKFGAERFAILKNRFNEIKDDPTFVDMSELMRRVRFSNAYRDEAHGLNHNPVPFGRKATDTEREGGLDSEWYSEKIPQSEVGPGGSVSDTTEEGWTEYCNSKFGPLKKAYWDAIENEQRAEADPAFWQTTHNSTYKWDWENKEVKLWIYVQEVHDNYENCYPRTFKIN